MPTRSILDRELSELRSNILQMSSLTQEAVDQSIKALKGRDVVAAHRIVAGDRDVNELRYEVERECLRILATQQPTAIDLRVVVASIHVANELERVGDHAAGIAAVVERLDDHEDIDSLHQLPKMARRAIDMIEQSVQSFITQSPDMAIDLITQDDKLDRQYSKLFRKTIADLSSGTYLYRATYLLWVGHNLERIGDRATNIAERAIFTLTGNFPDEEPILLDLEEEEEAPPSA